MTNISWELTASMKHWSVSTGLHGVTSKMMAVFNYFMGQPSSLIGDGQISNLTFTADAFSIILLIVKHIQFDGLKVCWGLSVVPIPALYSCTHIS